MPNNSRLEFSISHSTKNRANVEARLDGALVFARRIDLTSLEQVESYADGLHNRIPEFSAETIQEELLRLSADDVADDSTEEPDSIEPNNSKAIIKLTHEEGTVAEEVIGVLAQMGWDSDSDEESRLYSYKSGIAKIHFSNDSGVLNCNIILLQKPAIRELIADSCDLFETRLGKDRSIERIQKRPPPWLVEAIEFRGNHSALNRLTGIRRSPLLRFDGTVMQKPGWDPVTRNFYFPNAEYVTIPESPSHQDALDSLRDLRDLVSDFPFATGFDFSAFIAYLLTLIARPAIDGCVPLFGISANTPGTGKSLLADVASIIAFGTPAAKYPFASSENEQRKFITSIALGGIPSVVYDNVNVPLAGSTLDAVLTTQIWCDRILSMSKTTGELVMDTVFAATGNNMLYAADTARRALPIRLESSEESPESRSHFRYNNLLDHSLQNRPHYVFRCLTLLRAYFAAGCPPQQNGAWGSFDKWSCIIRGALVWAGADDPQGNRTLAA